MPIIYATLLFNLIEPCLMLVLVIFVCFLLSKCDLFQLKSLSESFAASVLIVYLLFYPQVVQNLFSLVSCWQFGEVSFIKANTSYECWTKEHVFYFLIVILPGLIIWVVLAPLLFAL